MHVAASQQIAAVVGYDLAALPVLPGRVLKEAQGHLQKCPGPGQPPPDNNSCPGGSPSGLDWPLSGCVITRLPASGLPLLAARRSREPLRRSTPAAQPAPPGTGRPLSTPMYLVVVGDPGIAADVACSSICCLPDLDEETLAQIPPCHGNRPAAPDRTEEVFLPPPVWRGRHDGGSLFSTAF